jgi:hypothetical protein
MINEIYSKVINEHRWPTEEELEMADWHRNRLKNYTYEMQKCLGQYLYDVKTIEYVHDVLKEVEKNYFR